MGNRDRQADTEVAASTENLDERGVFDDCLGLEKELLAAAFLEEVDVLLLPIERMSAQRMFAAFQKLSELPPFDATWICLKALQPDVKECHCICSPQD